MRFKRHLELEHGLKQIDIAPLVNMFFLLLLFFMLTSNFIMLPGIKVNLPRVVTSGLIKEEALEIAITAQSVIYLNGRVTTISELTSLIKRIAQKNPSILIKADRGASLGRVVEIWDLCRNLGISQINLVTEQE